MSNALGIKNLNINNGKFLQQFSTDSRQKREDVEFAFQIICLVYFFFVFFSVLIVFRVRRVRVQLVIGFQFPFKLQTNNYADQMLVI